MRWGTKKKQMENAVNLCYFASAEVSEPLQRDRQDIRGPVDCETFGCWHFLFAPERQGKKAFNLEWFAAWIDLYAGFLPWKESRCSLGTHVGVLSTQHVRFHKQFQGSHDVCCLLSHKRWKQQSHYMLDFPRKTKSGPEERTRISTAMSRYGS